MIRKNASILVLLCTVFFLTACGKKTFLQKNPDGTVTAIEYRNAVPFERAPYFEQTASGLRMTFNGIPWYEVSIVDPETAAWALEGKMIAESSNIRMVEANLHAAWTYACLMKLAGTEEAWILFYTDDLPGQSYGTDFKTSIRYFTDQIETIPDLDFTWIGGKI